MVSQFEVANNYTQINYKSHPVRVTPLEYGDLIKWFNNRAKGLPAYITIDMVTSEVNVVRLSEGMKYSDAEHFGRYIYRYLRFNYPTYMFDTAVFEIDENGTPYWICPRIVKRIGLFGGTDADGAVLVNAITGEHKYYGAKDVPVWVDKVYSAQLLNQQYNYHGKYINGFINSVFGQRGVTMVSPGYSYLSINDDMYMFTGVTSAGTDQSNVGFILANQRTKETLFFNIPGAQETSAMSSAQGVVQDLGYKATFPLLLNISSQPTYFMALKDAAGLVKSYAMVNISQYQIVAVGDTVSECEKTYLELMRTSGIGVNVGTNAPKVTGTIAKIAEGVISGNSHYYILLNNNDQIFDVNVADFIQIIKYNIGDTITFTYTAGTDANTVTNIE
jgi:hypothetical protein